MSTAKQPQKSCIQLKEWLDRPLELERLELLELAVPQVESFRSAIGVRNERQALFVRWASGDPDTASWGIGECSCRPDPFFNAEFLAGAKSVIEQFIFPALPRRGKVRDLVEILSRVRGWPFTTAAVLDAATDALRRQGIPDPVDQWPHPRRKKVPVGISLGLFPDAEAAAERIRREVPHGYRRMKLKISPQVDLSILERVRTELQNLQTETGAHSVNLGFDANGTFGEDDFGTLTELAELEPTALEQPFAPGRLDLCRRLKQQCPELRLCLDESLTGVGLLASAHLLEALDEANLKPGRVGGALRSLEFLEYCREHQLPAWVGGMFETGVGRAQNLRLASCLPDAEAHDLSPSRRYFKVDVLEQPIEMGPDGCVEVPQAPVAIDEDTLERLTVDRRVLKKA